MLRQTREDVSGGAQGDFDREGKGESERPSREPEIASKDEHDATPSWRREATAQAQLARVREGIREGHLKALSVNNVAKFAHCGSDRAEWIRSELVTEGLAERNPSGRLKVSAAA